MKSSIQTYISHWCSIEHGKIYRNGQLLYEVAEDASNIQELLKGYYREKNIGYPKFFKMDALSKLAFIGAEVLLEPLVLESPTTDIALLLSNTNSSLDSDQKHCESIEDADNFYPSPAIFVYTLANIGLAEISIKHKLQGENAFFISDTYDGSNLWNQTQYLLDTQRAQKVIAGYVDCLNDDYKLVFYMVEKEGTIPHTIENIQDII